MNILSILGCILIIASFVMMSRYYQAHLDSTKELIKKYEKENYELRKAYDKKCYEANDLKLDNSKLLEQQQTLHEALEAKDKALGMIRQMYSK